MRNGVPLCDQDQLPWLSTLRDILNEKLLEGKIVILGCSALKRSYRDILQSADPDYRAGAYETCVVKFVLLDAQAKVLMYWIRKRAAEGKHFMAVELLQSQIDLLWVDASKGIPKVDALLKPKDIVDVIKALIF